MAQKIYIVKRNSGKAIDVTNLVSISYDLNSPVSPLPLPEESHEENVLVKLEGNSAQMSISFKVPPNHKLYGTFSNANVFTVNSSTTSPLDFINKIKSEFIPTSIVDAYKLVVMENNNKIFEELGTIASVSFHTSAESPVTWDCSLTFFVGNVVGLYEANVPYHPEKVVMALINNNTVRLVWVSSKAYATSTDKPTATGASIKYKRDDAPIWVEYIPSGGAYDYKYALGNGGETGGNVPPSSNAQTYDVTGLSSGTYRFKVAELCNISDKSYVFYYTQGYVPVGASKEITITIP